MAKSRIKDGRRVLQAGDVIELQEVDFPWVKGRWRAKIIEYFDPQGDAYVTPVGKVDWNVVNRPEHYKTRGLFVTRDDLKTARIIKRGR